MKKIFTLLLAMGSLTMVFAQSGRYGNSNHQSNSQVNTYQQGHPDNQYSGHVQQNQYSSNQGNFNRGGFQDHKENGGRFDRNDRMMQERRNEYYSYSKPYRNHWNQKSFGRRDFRNREW